jgi:hypothetical protein
VTPGGKGESELLWGMRRAGQPDLLFSLPLSSYIFAALSGTMNIDAGRVLLGIRMLVEETFL